MSSPIVTTGSAPRRCRPPRRVSGAQPGQQLVHAERLGDVVVGAGVERVDLVGLSVRPESTRIGHVGPAAQPGDDLDAVDVGQAEVEDHERRAGAAAASRSASRAVGRGAHVVAPGAQVDAAAPGAIWGSSSTTRTRVTTSAWLARGARVAAGAAVGARAARPPW